MGFLNCEGLYRRGEGYLDKMTGALTLQLFEQGSLPMGESCGCVSLTLWPRIWAGGYLPHSGESSLNPSLKGPLSSKNMGPPVAMKVSLSPQI